MPGEAAKERVDDKAPGIPEHYTFAFGPFVLTLFFFPLYTPRGYWARNIYRCAINLLVFENFKQNMQYYVELYIHRSSVVSR